MKDQELKQCLKHAKSLKQPHETEIEDAYRFTYESRQFRRGAGSQATDRGAIYDNTAGAAVRNLATNAMRLLIPQTEQWAEIVFKDPDLARQLQVQLAEPMRQANSILFDHYTNSNFYLATSNALTDAIVSGTMCVMFIDQEDKPLSYRAIPVEELFFLQNGNEIVDVVFREHNMEARNIVDRFPDAPQEIRELAKDNPEKTHKIVECCVPDGSKWLYSVFLNEGWKKINEQSSDYNPFVVSRWEKSLGNVWGESWVRAALPSIRTVNHLKRDLLKFSEYAAFGLWQTKDDFPTDQLERSLKPGNILVVDEPLVPLQFPGNFQIQESLIRSEQQQIKSILHDSSLPNDEALKYMTAEAVLQRRNEFMRLVGEPAQRLQREYLQPIAYQCIARLQRRGEILVLTPDQVQSLGIQGARTQADLFKVDVNAAVQRANKMADTLEAVQAFATALQTVGPEQTALHIDMDKFTRESLRGAGFPMHLLRTEKEVQQIKKQRAEAAQQTAMLQAAETAAKSLGQSQLQRDPNAPSV